MPRPRADRDRALGPYFDADRGDWRVITRTREGKSSTSRYASESDARDDVDEYNRNAAVGATSLDDALEAYRHEFVVVRENKASSWPETRRRILRILADPTIDLHSLAPKRAQSLYDAITSQMATDSHRGCLTNVKTFFDFLVVKRVVEVNPFTGVKGTGRKKKGRARLHLDEAQRFAAAAFELLDGLLVNPSAASRVLWERHLMGLTALYLGARASEITLRQVRDIDAGATLYRVPDAKTPSGRRTERIPEELQPYYRLLVADRPGSEPLFPGRYWKRGRHHDHRYVTRYCVKPLMEILQLPAVTAHGLRGTFASLAAEEGATSIVVARSLGQAGARVAEDHYIDREAAAGAASRKSLEKLRFVARRTVDKPAPGNGTSENDPESSTEPSPAP